MPIPIATLTSHNLKTPLVSPLTLRALNQPFPSPSFKTHFSSPRTKLGLALNCNFRKLGFFVKAESKSDGDETEDLGRGESTMPDRFRPLTKEAPDPPLIWPWFVASGFLVYAWRAVLFELGNWKKAVFAVVGLIGYIFKLLLALIFHFIGDPITSLIAFLETSLYTARAFYSGIVAYAPVPELTLIIILSSAVLAVAEATVPSAVSCQPYLLTVAGLVSYAAVRSYISEPFFWTLLLGLYGFSRLVKKRDDVTSALPVAASLAAVGEPWIRLLAMVSYLALAITQHSKQFSQDKEVEGATGGTRVPMPLLWAALAIGIRLAAKWAGYRHLTWMVV